LNAGHVDQTASCASILNNTGCARAQQASLCHSSTSTIDQGGKAILGKIAAAGIGSGEEIKQEMIDQRVEALQEYRWNSYRDYAGSMKRPGWITTETILTVFDRESERARRVFSRRARSVDLRSACRRTRN
jgi:hypothetical protein